MPTIAKHNEVITVIFSLATEPTRQQSLIGLMIDALETTTKHQPGFVFASLHKSLDGTRTANYGQWRSLENFDTLQKEPQYESVREYWKGLAENEFHLYEVVFTEPAT